MILKNTRYSEMADQIKTDGSRIIVYGAGMIGQILVPYLIEKYSLYEYLSCFIDMDRRKHGKLIKIGFYEYKIKEPDILHKLKGRFALLITNTKFYPVLDFLDHIPGLEDTEVYMLPMMQIYELQSAKKISIQQFTQEPVIPKLIHYCWFSKKPMPDFLKNCIQTWRDLCPDYEILEWNEENYDVTKIRYAQEAYQNRKYGFVTDIARLDILYQYGGIYMDTDVTLLKNLDRLLYQPAFVGVEKWGNINTGGGCGAVPHHPMIKEMLDYRSGFPFVMEDGSLNTETNGMYETAVFIRHGMRIDNTMQRIKDVTVYPSGVFHPYDYMSCETQIESYTFSKHHFYGGWMDKNDLEHRKDTQDRYAGILKKIKQDSMVSGGDKSMSGCAVNDIIKVYQMLEDEESKEIYLARLNFLVSNDYQYLRRIIEKYVPQVSALNGGTIAELIASLPDEREIILYGAGEDAKASLHYWEKDKRFLRFCDGDEEKQRKGCCGYPVISPEELLQRKEASVVISTHRYYNEIRKFLTDAGFPSDQIYMMSPYMFCIDTGQYFNPDFIKFAEGEIFVDAGCKDLGSSMELTRYCRHLKKVYAFEPDAENYKTCMERKSNFKSTEVEVFPFGTWSERKKLCFDASGDGSSHVSSDGSASIEVMPIDEAVDQNEKITFIKMDVEGSELESLKGAKRTIRKDNPKLAVCIYHKPEDMVTIPLYIKELVPEYKLYIRHHSNGAGETVLYAVMPEQEDKDAV